MTQIHSSYFVCWTARSGSTLLSEALSATNVAGHPQEYLPSESLWSTGGNPSSVAWRQDWDRRPFPVCLANVLQFGSTPNGVFGMKVEAPNLEYLDRKLAPVPEMDSALLSHRLAHAFPDLQYIWVTRRNKVRQAISYFRAQQTGSWTSQKGEKIQKHELRFNLQLIDQYLRQILREEAAWSEFFTASRIVPYTVAYEDLTLDYEGTVRGVLDFLGISLSDQYTFPAPSLQKQADEVSEEWVRRYQTGMKRRHEYERLINLPFLLSSRSLRQAFVRPVARTLRANGMRSVRRMLSDAARPKD